MNILYEILVPTIYGDTLKPIRTRHHKKWDELVQAISGGMTILSSAMGKWTFKGVEYPEKVIPVRIMCNSTQMKEIVNITLRHYRQKAVMYYVLSNEVQIVYAKESDDIKAVRIAKERGWWLIGHKGIERHWYNGESSQSIDWDKPLIDQIPNQSTGNKYDDDEWLSQRYRSDGSRI